MSILKRNQRGERKSKDKVIPARVTEDEYNRFQSLCQETGYTMSEALRELILSELNPEPRASRPKPQTPVPAVAEDEDRIPTDVVRKPRVYNPIKKNDFGRFTVNKWKVDGFLPCPICKNWLSASNFSRHSQSHDMTTQELFETYGEEADRLLAERMEQNV